MNPTGKENILLVEDDEMLLRLLDVVLKDTGDIDVAHDGKMALDRITSKYYKLIVSDVKMPIMDGLTFFLKASGMFPNIKDRFLFITGYLSSDYEFFFKHYDLKYICKPLEMQEFKRLAQQIVSS